ncbi:hypothetical protein JRG66_08535 [Salinimicrobium tongyeongense]|jgi:hypothetical protein|uniref:Uncharacterized protein n=1 Tax=Salinimicrobium tongyeongense TaxID=2809707 RepID=A0ABY6NMH6_9FLAO|nr:hypothetical protein [Salinimicrobium tongyeongense]UZH54053.1 hypothetical protein JRG66_08535 [Salinimicrobium tongyeongense]
MKETNRREEDLKAGYTNEGPQVVVYRPVILHAALIGALIFGVVLAIAGYLIANGTWAIVDLGQISAPFPGTTAVTFGGVGMALGGLIGGLYGLSRMLREHKKSRKY